MERNELKFDSEFERLYTRSAPHILECIFFSLDYDSFLTCRGVCRVWKELHDSDRYQKMAKVLLDEKKKNEEQLWQCSKDGKDEDVNRLLRSGVNPNCIYINGLIESTPLEIATFRGHIDMVRLLLSMGADPNIRNKFGNTPLMLAAQYDKFKVAEVLLDAGADPKREGMFGITPVHFAAARNRSEEIKWLVDKGAEPNRATSYGSTPLHWAAAEGHTKSVEVLLDLGADPCRENIYQETPLHCALKHGREEVIEILQDRELPPN